jgi:hypothetical protein
VEEFGDGIEYLSVDYGKSEFAIRMKPGVPYKFNRPKTLDNTGALNYPSELAVWLRVGSEAQERMKHSKEYVLCGSFRKLFEFDLALGEPRLSNERMLHRFSYGQHIQLLPAVV